MGKFLQILAFVSVSGLGIAGDLERARDLFQRTDYRAALQILQQIPNRDAEVWEWMGRAHYMSGDFKKATEHLEKAVAADPGNSEYHHWLGRAWGRRAETSSWLTAIQYARKTRDSFEKAVALNPRNLEAVNDLFEYYLEAPGFLGGGLDRAAALSLKIRESDEVEYHYAAAKLAEARKEFGSAEAHLREATELAPRQVGRVVDLARFLAKQGKFQESDAAFQRALRLAPNNPKVIFAEAEALIKAKRNLPEARRLLKQYMSLRLTPEDPSREEAEKLLRGIQDS